MTFRACSNSMLRFLLLAPLPLMLCPSCLVSHTDAFLLVAPSDTSQALLWRYSAVKALLATQKKQQDQSPPTPSSSKQKASAIDARRRVLLSRKDPHFSLNRRTGRIEFGNTVRLINSFDLPSTKTQKRSKERTEDGRGVSILQDWISDAETFAPALWRSDKLTKVSTVAPERTASKQNSTSAVVYRMGLLPLQFVSLKFEPWVEVKCKTVLDSQKNPVFTLQSVGYNPNPTEILFIPGMPSTLTLDNVIENLKIEIEVVGQLRASHDSVGGRMVYQVNGTLPAALLLFPDPILRGAAETIGREVVKFAQQSFQTGSQDEFPKFVKSHQTRKKTQKQ